MVGRFMCRIGVHRPMRHIRVLFYDFIAKEHVRLYKCACGLDWMAHNKWGWRMKMHGEEWTGEDPFG